MTAQDGGGEALWVLRGTTERTLWCSVSEAPSELWLVTVSYGSETMLQESYPTVDSARLRATGLRDVLTGNGWRAANADSTS